MNRQMFAIAMLAALVCPGLYAQNTTLQAEVPFGFAIGDKEMPAGEYRVICANGVVTIRDVDGKRAAMTLTKPTLPAASAAQRRQGKRLLLFQRYGSEYFLSGVWTPSSREGMALPAGKRQKELAARLTTPEATTIAAASK